MKKRERLSTDGGGPSTSVVTTSSTVQYPRKKIRLLGVPEKSAITVLTDARNVHDPTQVLSFLEQFRSQFLHRDSSRSQLSQISALLLSIVAEHPQSGIRVEALSLAHALFNNVADSLSSEHLLDHLDDYIKLIQSHCGLGGVGNLNFPAKTTSDSDGGEVIAWMQQIIFMLTENITRERRDVDNETLDAETKFTIAASSQILDSKRVQLMVFIAKRCLAQRLAQVRINSIRLLDTLLLRSAIAVEQQPSLVNLMFKCSGDVDYRVRASAASALLQLYRRASALPRPEHYKLVRAWLCDTSSDVRACALECLLVFARYSPQFRVPSATDRVQIRLADDAFAAVSAAMNDLSISVRSNAARLLGEFHQISDAFVEQTLDKKLLAAMRTSDSTYADSQMSRRAESRWHRGGRGRGMMNRRGRRYQSTMSSAWATGKSLGEDIPVEEEEESIISSDVCGALVQALEDECWDVRLNGVHSLSRLASGPSMFWLSARAADCLADMFNDEIGDVRLSAVTASEPLLLHAPVEMHQLLLMLGVLDDGMPASRDAVRQLLSVCQISSLEGVKVTVKALMKNMRRFALDKRSIQRCMKYIGLHHPVFVQAIAGELLGFHPVFETSEPNITDPYYVAKLVLVLSASHENSPLRALLPAHIWRHYQFMRHDSPDLVMQIHRDTPDTITDIGSSKSTKSTDHHVTLTRIYSAFVRAVEMDKLDWVHKKELVNIIIKDFESYAGLLDTARAVGCYLADSARTVVKLMTLFQHLEHTKAFETHAEQFRQCLTRLRLLYSSDSTEAHKFLARMQYIASVAQTHVQFGDTKPVPPMTPATGSMISPLQSPIGSPLRPTWNTPMQQLTVLSRQPMALPPLLDTSNVGMITADVLEPDLSVQERVIEFVTGMLTSVRLVVLLRNWKQPSDGQSSAAHLYYTVEYPDGSTSERKLLDRDLKSFGTDAVRVETDVVLHAKTRKSWTHSAQVKIRLFICDLSDRSQQVELAVAGPVKLRPVPRL